MKDFLLKLLLAGLYLILFGMFYFLAVVMIDAYTTHDFSCGNSGFYEDSDC